MVGGDERLNLLVDVLKLGVPVQMRAALPLLGVGLQLEAEFL